MNSDKISKAYQGETHCRKLTTKSWREIQIQKCENAKSAK